MKKISFLICLLFSNYAWASESFSETVDFEEEESIIILAEIFTEAHNAIVIEEKVPTTKRKNAPSNINRENSKKIKVKTSNERNLERIKNAGLKILLDWFQDHIDYSTYPDNQTLLMLSIKSSMSTQEILKQLEEWRDLYYLQHQISLELDNFSFGEDSENEEEYDFHPSFTFGEDTESSAVYGYLGFNI